MADEMEMPGETYEFTNTETTDDDFTINGGEDGTFPQQPVQDIVQHEQSLESDTAPPGTQETDFNGTSEHHEMAENQEMEEYQQTSEHQEDPVSVPGVPDETEGEQQEVDAQQFEESAVPSEDQNQHLDTSISAPGTEHQDGFQPRSADKDKKLFVGGLTYDTTAAQVREHFEQYGEIENVDLKLHENGQSRCFAFVQFYDTNIIDKVIKLGPEHMIINGKSVDPKPANPRGSARRQREMEDQEPALTKKVFVGGVGPELEDDLIKEHFKQYGEVDGIERPRQQGLNAKKYLFVMFVDDEGAKAAIENNKQEIGGVLCDVNRATPKQDYRGGGYGGPRGGFQGPPRGRGRGRGYGPPAPYGGGYDQHGYGYDPHYGYDPNYYGYDPSYYSGYDPSYYGGYDPSYYQNYAGYDWSGYYGQQQGYDYSQYYGQQGAAPAASGDQAPAAYDGGKSKRGAPAGGGQAGYHPYSRK